MTEPSSLEPSIALAAYAEPLASNRRVLLFGNALGSLPLQLLERGARSVHVCDPEALRVAEASARNRSTQISFSSLADSDLSLQGASFELALIDNLGAFNGPSLLQTTKRALGARGVAVVTCPNPEAAFPLLGANNPSATSLDYYALYDAVAAEFEYVRMLGQTPFVGYAIADFSASGEPEPALDTSFVPGGAEEPDWFIALASGHEVRLDEFAVIQLPTRRLLGAVAALGAAAAPKVHGLAHDAELSRLNHWIRELESRASTADERADHAETELEEAHQKLLTERQTQTGSKTQHDRELSALKAELSALRNQAVTLRAESSKREAELGTLRAESGKREAELMALRAESGKREAELGTLRAESGKRETELMALRSETNRRDAELSALRAQSGVQTSEVSRLSGELARVSAELQNAKGDATADREIAEFERQLLERGGEVRKLEHDLRTAERTGRELVRELERRRGEAATLSGAVLERALAEREADLQAAAWTIESLSLRLELAGKPATNQPSAPESALPSEGAR
jgi:hypothetical protein